MSFARILGVQPKSTSKQLVTDVIKITTGGGSALGRNVAGITDTGAGDYTIELLGVGGELLGVTLSIEDAEASEATWHSYDAAAKTFDVNVWDDDGAAHDDFDSVTVVLFWNASGTDENV